MMQCFLIKKNPSPTNVGRGLQPKPKNYLIPTAYMCEAFLWSFYKCIPRKACFVHDYFRVNLL